MCAALLAASSLTAAAAPFTSGNILVVRVGDGSAAVPSGTAAAVFVDEYTRNGLLVQSVVLPTTVSGTQKQFTLTANATSEGMLALSADQRYVTLLGYDAAPGTASVVGSAAARVVARIDANGNVDTSTGLTDAYLTSNARGAVTDDGTRFWLAGNGTPTSSAGTRYATLGASTSTQISATPSNVRVVGIYGGQLYVTSASGSNIGVNAVGTGLPTTAGQTATLVIPSSGTSASPYGFALVDIDASVPGPDVAYVADDRTAAGGGIAKYSLVNGTWTANGVILAPTSVRGLAAQSSGNTVTLFATGNTALYTGVDVTGYNGAVDPAGSLSLLATSATNTVLRGVALAPANATTQAPTIASFTPSSGPIGTVVTITGTNFTGATAVSFNGTAATTFTVNSATQITVTVPTGTTNGPITVTTPGGTVTSSLNYTVTQPNPVPVLTAISPNTATAGGAGFTLRLTGSNFMPASVVNFNGTALTTTFVSVAELTAAVPASAIATAGSYNVTVTNPAPGGGNSAPQTFTVTSATPAPTVTSFTPTSGPVGTVVTITGTNFTGATGVSFNGTAATTFSVTNATTISATVPSGATSGTIAVTTPGGTATSTGSFTVTVPTPAPVISSFNPTSGPVGTVVTITGINFTGATGVSFNGTAATTFTVNSATSISATVPTGATTGTISVTTPGGTDTSNGTFTVTTPNPAPTISSLAPSTAVAGGAAFTLTVNGTGFGSGSVVSFNGTALTTTVVSATQLTAAVPASAIATAGTYNVTVTNPAPGGGTATATFTVTTPAPTIASFTPTSGPVGTVVTITGTNFTGATGVSFNGTAATTFSVTNATTLTATVPTGATTGTIAVTTPGGTATSTGSFTVTVPTPAPTIASFTPASGPVGTVVTITGTNFTGATAVSFNGTAATTFTVSSATSITATVPTGATTGTISVTTPSGTATSTSSFTVTTPTPAPTVASFTPTSGPVGTVVTITGTNFTGATAVSFNGTAATTFSVTNATTISATVPTGATTGTIAVTTPGGTATSTGSFTVTVPTPAPTITAISPSTGAIGSLVTITGTNLTGATAVAFNGVNAPSFTVVSATSITVTVPTGATTGTISVTTPGGTASSPNVFTVTTSTAARAASILDGLTVYPNPVERTLYVRLAGAAPAAEVQVTDMLGRVVLSGRLAADGSFDTSRLPAGQYLVKLATKYGQTTRKLNKQ
ncbi:T9SS type A sorting domain-containing protein [Hymenobacter gummosus]|uniref:T9SS type A sorting domain-containing protein n=1 Tax=Hymenobacter gummosus TaxID=1776032 RepID=A0A431U093_9BACT|nr:IPT/TIG domain-containing protein [Hymenobacter gummosus]RTQ48200.1 T9SS type A sorting domain-containing protein [Hymenobacter gummosus]